MINTRLESVKIKQDLDLERWRRKLVNAQADTYKKVEKSLSLELIMEEKGNNVMDKHRKRQEVARAKNETAIARVKANESKLVARRNQAISQMYQQHHE